MRFQVFLYSRLAMILDLFQNLYYCDHSVPDQLGSKETLFMMAQQHK